MLNRFIARQNVYMVMDPIDKRQLFEALSKKAFELGYITDIESMVAAVEDKESAGVMELKPHIVLPHARGDFIKKLFIIIAIAKNEIKYKGAKKSKMQIALFVGIPSEDKEYLKLLASISRIMQKDEFIEQLLKANVPEDIVYTIKKYSMISLKQDKQSSKKFLIFLSLNKNFDGTKAASLLTEVGVDLPTEIEGKNLGNASMFIPFLSSFGFGGGINKYNHTYFGLTDEKEAASKLNSLLKTEGVDLTEDGVGSLFQIEVMESYGGFAEVLDF